MRKSKGISRNRLEALQLAKDGLTRKKNIFKIIGKEDEFSEESLGHGNQLLSDTTKHSNSDRDHVESNPYNEIYEEAKEHLRKVAEYRNKMAAEIKLRMSSFKDSEIKAYDDNITKYSAKAVEHLLKSERILGQIRTLKSSSSVEEKFYRNMEKSLALEVVNVSRALRSQEKDYFDRLKSYESGSANLAIQLRQEDRQRMKDDFQDMEICETEMGEDQQRNKQIAQLVKLINEINGIYKHLNELVIEQGSLIDRIDFNLEEANMHIEKGIDHLKNTEKHASSPCAQKCMCILIILILAMACVIGFKMAKTNPK